MASIYKEILINARPEDVWAALRNVGAAHHLVPGVIVDTRLEADTRTLTFADGTVYHEVIVDVNNDTCRVAYASIGGETRHHNASMQVFADGADRSRLIWITDVLPNEFAAPISKLMDQNAAVIKQALEKRNFSEKGNDLMTRITTPFGFQSTATEVVVGIDLSGKRVIVTGASSGLGVETARALARTGADVTLAVRNPDAGEQVAADIIATTGNQAIHVAQLDLANRVSIADFVAAWKGPLHVLVNNAGIMASPELRTSEGWEMQFAVNHLGHFALTLGLHDALAAEGAARVVAVSSTAHMRSPVVFDDIHFCLRRYDPWLAYGQSKTANVLFAVGITARWAHEGITANAAMPGAIVTNLLRYVGSENASTPPELRKTPEQGAATSVLLATSPLLEGIGGRYFANCTEQAVVRQRTTDLTGVAPFALDPNNADRLWEESLRLLA